MFKATVLASGQSQTFPTRAAAERWAEVTKGLGRMSYKVEATR